ncbi:MAG: hypothetical protein JNN27_03550 [Planctomycetes bacterium]|nr:hypothetical protein [Planctomycetota bacterium]
MKRWIRITLLALWPLTSCGPQADVKPVKDKPAAAKLERADKDGAVKITLAPQAEARLGLVTVPARRERIARTKTLAGFVERPPDSDILVRAPFAGSVRSAANGIPRAGATVAAGAELLQLEVWITPNEQAQIARLRQDLALSRAQARGVLERAQARLAVTKIAVDRAEALLAQDAGSARARDDALGEHQIATTELEAARALEAELAKLDFDALDGEGARIPILASAKAQVLDVTVGAGQRVEAGALLLTLARLDSPWLRVPLYVGDLADAALDRDVTWTTSADSEAAPRRARPTVAPPSANALAATVDAWFEVEGPNDDLRPGQRVDVTVALRGDEERLAAPWSGVLFDEQGATWVYVRVADHVYSRRRIELVRRSGDLALIARGLTVGDEVVSEAAAELFGVEFGVGK